MTPYDPVTSPHLPEVFAERTAPPAPLPPVSEHIHGNLTHRSEVEHLVCRGAWRADRQLLGNMAGGAVTSVSVCHCGHYDTCHRGHCMILITVVMWYICDMSLLTFWHMTLWSLDDTCHCGHYDITEVNYDTYYCGHYIIHVTVVIMTCHYGHYMTLVTIVIIWHMTL